MEFLTSLDPGVQFFIQLLVVLVCLFYGAKKGGIALGLLGGVGLLVLVFLFNVQPGKPSIAVMLTILAVVVASATLQASGGLDVMLQIAEKILRKNPKFISILAPIVTCFLTILCGTGHVVYTILPIIYDIAIKNGIRPERPMAASSIGAQMGIIASPVSVAVVTLSAFLIADGINLPNFNGYTDLLKITIPSTFIGILAVGIFSWFRGKDLEKDEIFQEKLKDPEFKKYVYGEGKTLLNANLPKSSWVSMWIFLSAIAAVAFLGYFKDLRPSWDKSTPMKIVQISKENEILKEFKIKDGKLESIVDTNLNENIKAGKTTHQISYKEVTIYQTKTTLKDGKESKTSTLTGKIYQENNGVIVDYGDQKTTFMGAKIKILDNTKSKSPISMVDVIQIFMLLAGALMIIFAKTDANKISKNEIFRSGMIALVAVFGISWMAETMFAVHTPMLKNSLGAMVTTYPWTYAVMLLLISKFVNSQAAALVAFVPLALGIGVHPAIILAFAPACYGYYILPTYPSDLAAIQFDRSGTTHIGKFVINHSFILPGLIGVGASCVAGYILAKLFGYL